MRVICDLISAAVKIDLSERLSLVMEPVVSYMVIKVNNMNLPRAKKF
jgi:hypothetical protein